MNLIFYLFIKYFKNLYDLYVFKNVNSLNNNNVKNQFQLKFYYKRLKKKSF